jgi:hypothetical protein
MKLKGIKPWEQHIEKGVLGLCGIALAGGLVWQLFLQKAEVKVGNQTVAPADAFGPVKAEADKLRSRIEATQPKLPEIPSVDLASKLKLGASAPAVASAGTALGPAPRMRVAGPAVQVANSQFALPAIAAPTAVVAASYRATIDPVEAASLPELANLLPPQQPFDKASVSVEATFSGAQVAELLGTDPDGTGPLEPMPQSWWRDVATGVPTIAIVGVEVERMVVRGADGKTPAEDKAVSVVPPMPGRPSFIQVWKDDVRSAGDVPPMVEEVTVAAEDVLRPEFYRTIAGPAWAPPAEMVVSTDEDPNAREIRRSKNRVAEIDKALRRFQAAPKDNERPPVREDSGGGRKGGGGREAPTQDKRDDKGPEQDRERAIKRLQDERKKLVDRLKVLGDKTHGSDTDGTQPAAVDERPWIVRSDLKVFAHDLTAEPGAEYKYRVRIVMNNPLFGRGLQESQKALAEQSLLTSAWSEWTKVVPVDRNSEFFIVSAGNDPLTGRPTASAQLFEFYYGYYRKASASVEPGDGFRGTAKLPAMLPNFFDFEKLKADVAAGKLPQAPGGVDPRRERDGMPPDGGGRRVSSPNGPGEPEKPAAGAAIDRGPGTIAPPESRLLTVPSIFLGIRQVPGLDSNNNPVVRTHAVLRDQTNSVMSTGPEAVRLSELYKRLSANAELGERQGKEESTDVPPPPGGRPPRPGVQPPPGGGGGGGG